MTGAICRLEGGSRRTIEARRLAAVEERSDGRREPRRGLHPPVDAKRKGSGELWLSIAVAGVKIATPMRQPPQDRLRPLEERPRGLTLIVREVAHARIHAVAISVRQKRAL